MCSIFDHRNPNQYSLSSLYTFLQNNCFMTNNRVIISLYYHMSNKERQSGILFFQRSIWYIPLLKSVLNLLQYCFCFYALVFWPLGMWNLSSLTRDQTHISSIVRQSLNHWTAWEVPKVAVLFSSSNSSTKTNLLPLIS